jgi:NitT/TauT family transport system substrate-binding protein
MKKIILSIFLIIIVISIIICFNLKNENQDSNLTKVKVAEVTHSIFYAPQYIAISEGFFEEEGLEIDLSLTSGADAVTAAVLSGDVDIGLCGTEATIYVYNAKESDYLMTFAGLTKRDGSFLVSRIPYENFTLEDLKGKYIIGGRQGYRPKKL